MIPAHGYSPPPSCLISSVASRSGLGTWVISEEEWHLSVSCAGYVKCSPFLYEPMLPFQFKTQEGPKDISQLVFAKTSSAKFIADDYASPEPHGQLA